MKPFVKALLGVMVALGAVMPPAFAADLNPSGDTGSATGSSTQSSFPAVIPETRFRGNVRFPNMTILGGDQTVQDNSNGANTWSNIPSLVLRPFGKRPKDALDTTIKWTTPAAARTYTIPDAGGNANFVLLSTAQSVAGAISRADLAAETGVKYDGALMTMRNVDGTVLDATGGAGKFKISTTGTFGAPASLSLVSEAAQGNTKTDVVEFEFRLPAEYTAGAAITVNVESNVTGAGTLGATKTLTVDAFKVAADGTVGSNLGPAAGTLATGAAANQAFTITPTGLNPGDKLLIQVQASLNETGGVSPVNANLDDINVALNIKG